MNTNNKALNDRFQAVKAVFMDVDGVLTKGEVTNIDGKINSRTMNVKDRLILKAISTQKEPAFKIFWLSGRNAHGDEAVADELGITGAFWGVNDKYEKVSEILNKYSIDKENIVYIGDDLVDLKSMVNAGLACCPRDAVREIKDISDYISEYEGGKCAVRDILQYILESKGLWDDIVKGYRT